MEGIISEWDLLTQHRTWCYTFPEHKLLMCLYLAATHHFFEMNKTIPLNDYFVDKQ